MTRLPLHASVVCALFCACRGPGSVDAGVDGGDAGAWKLVLDDLPATLFSAWESSDGVLYAVGGTSSRAYVLRHDSLGWWEMDVGTRHALWWVHGFSASDVYAVGAKGVVAHFDGSRWTTLREGGEATLFGLWGATATGLVAVGGVATGNQPRSALMTGAAGWAEVPTAGLPVGRALFKVWGQGASDLVVVGEAGLIARGRPGQWVVQSAPTTERLTTVHGSRYGLYAVGGLFDPVALRFDGAQWQRFAVPGEPQLLSGVAVAGGEVVIVGLHGYVAEGYGESFREQPSITQQGLHGAVATRDGFVAVGGDLLGTPGRGVLLARGGDWGAPSPVLLRWPEPGVPFDAGAVDGGHDGGFDGGFDAGADAGSDAGWVDPGWLGPGAPCDSDPGRCDPGLSLTCWLVFGPFKSYCGALCTDAGQCGAYGAGSCCKVPGPQVIEPVCLPAEACDGGN